MKLTKSARYSLTLGMLLIVMAPSYVARSSNQLHKSAQMAADKRQSTSISEDWQNAKLVCAGVLQRNGVSGGATFQIKETLKGDRKKGQKIEIPVQRQLAGIFPTDLNEKTALVFFGNKPDSQELEANEIYSDVDKIEATKCLSTIFDEAERQRLQALSDLVLSPSSRCNVTFKHDARAMFRAEFLAAIAQMRDKNNFEIVTQLYKKGDAATKRELLEWMACTGDRRTLPFLIDAVYSPDSTLRTTAMTRLTYYFPGDEGVNECVKEAYEEGFADTRNLAFDYLKRRGKIKPSQPNGNMNGKTAYQQAEELFTNGKYAEAVPLYLREITNSKADEYVRRWSTLKAIPYSSHTQRDEIRTAILALVSEDAAKGNYLEATDAALILQKLDHVDCLDSLIVLLDRRDLLFAKANRAAAFGIAKLGQEARQKAVDHILANLKTEKINSEPQEKQITTLLELIWIGTKKDYVEAGKYLHGSASEIWSSLAALQADNDKAHDEHFLLQVLNEKLPHLAKDWVIAQLGEMRSEKAADLILAHLKEMKFQHDGYVSEEALKQIGGEYVSKQLEKIALSNDEISRNAVDVLCDIKKEKSIPILRKIIESRSYATTNALSAMARLGSKDDLKILVPLSDFWTGDRTNHYWTMEAIANIRLRFGYDVNSI